MVLEAPQSVSEGASTTPLRLATPVAAGEEVQTTTTLLAEHTSAGATSPAVAPETTVCPASVDYTSADGPAVVPPDGPSGATTSSSVQCTDHTALARAELRCATCGHRGDLLPTGKSGQLTVEGQPPDVLNRLIALRGQIASMGLQATALRNLRPAPLIRLEGDGPVRVEFSWLGVCIVAHSRYKHLAMDRVANLVSEEICMHVPEEGFAFSSPAERIRLITVLEFVAARRSIGSVPNLLLQACQAVGYPPPKYNAVRVEGGATYNEVTIEFAGRRARASAATVNAAKEDAARRLVSELEIQNATLAGSGLGDGRCDACARQVRAHNTSGCGHHLLCGECSYRVPPAQADRSALPNHPTIGDALLRAFGESPRVAIRPCPAPRCPRPLLVYRNGLELWGVVGDAGFDLTYSPGEATRVEQHICFVCGTACDPLVGDYDYMPPPCTHVVHHACITAALCLRRGVWVNAFGHDGLFGCPLCRVPYVGPNVVGRRDFYMQRQGSELRPFSPSGSRSALDEHARLRYLTRVPWHRGIHNGPRVNFGACGLCLDDGGTLVSFTPLCGGAGHAVHPSCLVDFTRFGQNVGPLAVPLIRELLTRQPSDEYTYHCDNVAGSALIGCLCCPSCSVPVLVDSGGGVASTILGRRYVPLEDPRDLESAALDSGQSVTSSEGDESSHSDNSRMSDSGDPGDGIPLPNWGLVTHALPENNEHGTLGLMEIGASSVWAGAAGTVRALNHYRSAQVSPEHPLVPAPCSYAAIWGVVRRSLQDVGLEPDATGFRRLYWEDVRPEGRSADLMAVVAFAQRYAEECTAARIAQGLHGPGWGLTTAIVDQGLHVVTLAGDPMAGRQVLFWPRTPGLRSRSGRQESPMQWVQRQHFVAVEVQPLDRPPVPDQLLIDHREFHRLMQIPHEYMAVWAGAMGALDGVQRRVNPAPAHEQVIARVEQLWPAYGVDHQAMDFQQGVVGPPGNERAPLGSYGPGAGRHDDVPEPTALDPVAPAALAVFDGSGVPLLAHLADLAAPTGLASPSSPAGRPCSPSSAAQVAAPAQPTAAAASGPVPAPAAAAPALAPAVVAAVAAALVAGQQALWSWVAPPPPYGPPNPPPLNWRHLFPLGGLVYLGSVPPPVALDSWPIHWVRVAGRRRLRGTDRDWAAGPTQTSCRCHDQDRLLPCSHLRNANFVMLGPDHRSIPGITWLKFFKTTGHLTWRGATQGTQLLMLDEVPVWAESTSTSANDHRPAPVSAPAGYDGYVGPGGTLVPTEHLVLHRLGPGQVELYSAPPMFHEFSNPTAVCRALALPGSAFSLCRGVTVGGVLAACADVSEKIDLGLFASAFGLGGHLGHATLASAAAHGLGYLACALALPAVAKSVLAFSLVYALKVSVGWAVIRLRRALRNWVAEPDFLEMATYALVDPVVMLSALSSVYWGSAAPEYELAPSAVSDTSGLLDYGPTPDGQAVLEEVRDYFNARRELTRQGFELAQQGIIRFRRAGRAISRQALETARAVHAATMGLHLSVPSPLKGAGSGPNCWNHAWCGQRVGKARKGTRSMRLCIDCRGGHPGYPGSGIDLGGLDVTFLQHHGPIPFMPVRSRRYLRPPGQPVCEAGAQLRTSMPWVERRTWQNEYNRKVACVIGFVISGWLPGHQSFGLNAILEGLLARTFQPRPAVPPGLLRFYRQWLNRIDPPVFGASPPMNTRHWVETHPRRDRYEPEYEAYLQDGVDEQVDRLGITGLFTKSDQIVATVNVCTEGPEPQPAPRTAYKNRDIYNLSLRGHVVMGPSYKAASDYLAKHYGVHEHLHYASKDSPAQLNEWLARVAPLVGSGSHYAVLGDESRFETTKHKAINISRYEWLCAVWGNHDSLRDRVEQLWRALRFSARDPRTNHKVSGKLPPEMMPSGEDGTTVKNGRDNMTATDVAATLALLGLTLVQALALSFEELEARILEARELWFGAFAGDDSVLIVPAAIDPAQFLPALTTNMLQQGFIYKCAVATTVPEIVFLGMRPYWTVDGYRWGPTLGRRLYKHHVARDLQGDPWEWCAQVCAMEIATCGHVPVISEMAHTAAGILRQRIGGPKPLRRRDRERLEAAFARYDQNPATVHPRAVEETARLYGAEPEDLNRLIREVCSVRHLPFMIDDPLLRRMCELDNG